MTENVTDKQTATHYLWGDLCHSWVLVDNATLSVKQESMPAGTKEQWHFHNNAQQFFFILEGTASFYLEDRKITLLPQKGLLVHPRSKHFIANETDEPLEFLVISQPGTNNDRITLTQQ